jgi:glycerophosphoryl diester phosphodiesterase
MGAFEQARAQGARAFELGVSEVPLQDLRTIDLGEGQPVPTLAGVLAWARSRDVAVNVEMKHDVPNRLALARETVRVVRESRADVLLSSFHPILLVAAAAVAPAVRRALLTQAEQGRWAHALQEIARPPLVHAVHIERIQGAPRAIARYLRRGLRVGVWTVNDPHEARDLVGVGAGSIITDAPGQLLTALGRS